ncbi:MAG: hypothetical protein K2O24_01990 [Muribaculaceae bacterium]|nr:hypothetical protein [Muribaculaceae bacterium]
MTPPKKKSAKKESGPSGQLHTIASDLRYGRSVSAGFFRKNAWLLVAFLAAVLSLMGLRYKTKSKMAEIKQLTVELQRAESSKLQEKALYMSLIRETEMKRLVDEKGLGLQFREEPPYQITYEK